MLQKAGCMRSEQVLVSPNKILGISLSCGETSNEYFSCFIFEKSQCKCISNYKLIYYSGNILECKQKFTVSLKRLFKSNLAFFFF